MNSNAKVKKYVMLGMLCAIAYTVMAVGRFPVVLFLKYDPKDVIIAIGGFLFGPLSAALISLVVSVLEMFTLSDTGIIGCIMNVLSSCTFTCTAAWIYEKHRTLKGATIGLIIGGILTVATMLLWNYLITPLYMTTPRDEVAKLLLPAFLPFNLLKVVLNGAITMLLYKPVATALRKAHLVEVGSTAQRPTKRQHGGAIAVCLVLMITCVLWILVLQGIL